jgi:hypothetical protein
MGLIDTKHVEYDQVIASYDDLTVFKPRRQSLLNPTLSLSSFVFQQYPLTGITWDLSLPVHLLRVITDSS